MRSVSCLSIIVLLTLGSSTDLKAQAIGKKTTVYLQNGNIISGDLKDHLPFDYIEIQILEDASVRIPKEEIKKISQFKDFPAAYLKSKKGLLTTLEVGMNFGEDISYYQTGNGVSIHLISGYQFSNHIALGVGVGADDLKRQKTVPLYLSLRGDVLNGKVTPVYQADAGYGFVTQKDEVGRTNGGMYLHPGLGVKIYAKRLAWGLNAGYKIQKTSFNYSTPSFDYKEDRKYKRLTFRALLYF